MPAFRTTRKSRNTHGYKRQPSLNRTRRNYSYTTNHDDAVVGGLMGTINNAKTTRAGAERARDELKHVYGVKNPPKRKWTTDLKRFLHIGTGHRHSSSHGYRRY